MSTTEKLVIELHASALRQTACQRLTFLKIVRRLDSKGVNNDTYFGTCFHKFAELYSTGNGLAMSLAQATTMYRERSAQPDFLIKKSADYLDVFRLTQVCNEWARQFDNSNFVIEQVDGKHMTEVDFKIPMYSDEFVDILLVGTLDKIGKIQGGVYCIGDYKTTRSWGDPEDYFGKYQLDPQLLAYKYAVLWHAEKYPDSIFATIAKQNFGCFIEGIFLTKKETTFLRSKVFMFSDYDMQEFSSLLRNKVLEIARLATMYAKAIAADLPNACPPREGRLNGVCNTIYGGCPFYGACSSPDERSFEYMLDEYFIRSTHGE